MLLGDIAVFTVPSISVMTFGSLVRRDLDTPRETTEVWNGHHGFQHAQALAACCVRLATPVARYSLTLHVPSSHQ